MTFNQDEAPGQCASICLALVHNNDESRNAAIRSGLAKLGDFLGACRRVTSVEVSWQPPLASSSTGIVLKRNLQYQILERNWLRYRAQKPTRRLSVARKFFNFSKSFLQNKDGLSERLPRNSAIELAVTDKHIRAWDRFLDSDADLLICFEDDAIFKESSAADLSIVLAGITHLKPDELLYVDLAGGMPVSTLKIAALEDRKEGFFTYYKKPVTNTACSYLLSRSTACLFKAIILNQPSLRHVSIDWLLNALFIELEKQGKHSLCFHADPTVFNHGSTTGECKAWQR